MEDFDLLAVVDENVESINALADSLQQRADNFQLCSVLELRDIAKRLKDHAYDLEMASLEAAAQHHDLPPDAIANM